MSADSSSVASTMTPGGGLFVRQATGLVRELSLRDNVLLSASYISIFLGFTYLTLVPSTFVGADIALAFLVTFLLCVPHFVTYGWLSSAMPRSGGDYLFLSRIVHPLVGFIVNGIISLVFILGLANVALTVPQFALPAMFESLSFITGNSYWLDATTAVTSPMGQLLTAGVLIALTGVIGLFSARTVARWTGLLFVIGIVGAIMALIGLATINPTDFAASFQHIGSVSKILSTAHQAGVDPTHSDTGALFASVIIISVAIGYGYIPTYWGGEVRRAKSMMVPSMLLGGGLATGVLVLAALLAVRAIGADFLGSAGYVQSIGSPAWPFPSAPALYLFVAIAHPNIGLVVALGISFVAGIAGTLLPSYIVLSRNALAWAIDRVVPAKFAEVNPRTHTPVFTTGVAIVLSLVVLVLDIWPLSANLVLIFAIVSLMAFVVWMTTGIAAVLFPFTAKDLFANSPVRWKVGGLPVISIVGALDALIMGYFIYLIMFSQWGPIVGLKTGAAVAVITVEIAAFTVIWLVAFFVSRRRGISLTLAQQALPPE